MAAVDSAATDGATDGATPAWPWCCLTVLIEDAVAAGKLALYAGGSRFEAGRICVVERYGDAPPPANDWWCEYE